MAATSTTMLPRLPVSSPFSSNHTSGIYADMTVDGPEIGTLVVVVDRAKNLPNLRTMGKQDPYCAARLAKEAKKTETDRRGGQTPRWDQELRFVVRDSPDYQKLKVSVFNDDRKTDLIGETWIYLDNILRRGGGQADDWHRLSIKERYAGEIRMELTFYDSRPKVDRPRKQSNASSTQLDQPTHLPRLADSVPRKPLPFQNTASVAPLTQNSEYSTSGYHMPQPTLAGYQASLRQPADQEFFQDHQQFSSHRVSGSRPLPIPSQTAQSNHSSSYCHHELQPLETHYSSFPNPANPTSLPTPPRHNRVNTLSGAANPRPQPPYELPHAKSAPQFDSSDHFAEYNPQEDQDYGELFLNRNYLDEMSRNAQFNGAHCMPRDLPGYGNPHQQWQNSSNVQDDPPPPPPPIHRNSAPPVPSPFARAPPNLQQTRAANVPSHTIGVSPRGWSSQDPQPSPNSFQHHLSQSAESSVRPRNEMASDPRAGNKQHPFSGYPGSTHVSKSEPLKLIKPIAVNPARDQAAQQQTPRKSVNPTTPEKAQAGTPYSPDSFDAFNPNHSTHSTPETSSRSKSEPLPMYSPQSSTQTKGVPSEAPQSPQLPSPSTKQSPLSNEPIIGSDGRIKDPSDHLPLSSYAPEPERPQNRPTTVVNLKTRLGPREARSTISTDAQPRQHKYSQSSTTSLASSPLSPTQSNILNMYSGGYNLSSPYPPPVPGKIPLGGYQSQVDEHDHFEMAALSLEEDRNYQADSGAPNANAAYNDERVRVIRSRWRP